jgi:hypothetical protein
MIPFVLTLTLFGFNLKLVEQNNVPDRPFLTSRAGNYLCQVEYTPHGAGETPIAEFSLFDRSHQLVTTLHEPGIEMIFVSDAGWLVGALNSASKVRLTFYDRAGNVRVQTETDAPANYAFSNSGTYFYVNNARGMQAFDAEGRVAAQFPGGAWFKPSDDDRFVAVVSGDRVEVHAFGEESHTQISQIPGSGEEKNRGIGAIRGSNPKREAQVTVLRLGSLLFRDLAFSPDGEYLAVAERSAISLYSLSGPDLVWKQRLDPSVSLLSLAVNDQGRVCAAGEIDRRGFLSVIEDGREMTRCPINYTDDHETVNTVEVDRGTIQVSTTLHRFRFEEEK